MQLGSLVCAHIQSLYLVLFPRLELDRLQHSRKFMLYFECTNTVQELHEVRELWEGIWRNKAWLYNI